MPRRVGGLPRILVILGVLALLAMPTTAPAAAGEPGSAPFLQVRVDSVTPDLITTTSEPTVTVTGTVTNVGDRPVRDVVARLEHAAAVTSSAGLRTNLDGANEQFQPVGEFTTVAAEMQRGQAVGFTFSYPIRSPNAPSLGIDRPGVYPLLVNINGTPDYGDAARLDDARFLLPVLGRAARSGRPRSGHRGRRRTPRHHQARRGDDAVAAGRQATPGPRGAGRHHTGAADERRPGGVAGCRRPAGHPAVGGRLRHQPAGGSRRRDRSRAVPGHRSRPVGDRQRDDHRLRRRRRARRTGCRRPPGHRPGRRGGLAGQAARPGQTDVRRPHPVRAGRSRRPAARRGRRAQLRGDQRRRRHHRSDPGRHVRARRHDPG